MLTIGVYAYQAYIMNGSLHEAKTSADAATSAAKTADATLKAMTKGAVETSAQIERLINQQQRTADSMERNLVRSKIALDASIEMTHISQRAWIGFKSMTMPQTLEVGPHKFEFHNEVPAVGLQKYQLWKLQFSNVGNTPASNVAAWWAMSILDKLPTEDFVPYGRPKHSSVSSSGTLAKGATLFLECQRELSGHEVADVMSGKRFLVVWGAVEYLDIFQSAKDKPRRTEYCMFWNRQVQAPAGCSVFNVIK